MGPLVSVVIPCFNHARFLPDAIRSVQAQTYSYIEIVVVDDGSTDDTRSVAASFRGVSYMRQENRGLAAARNTGLRESRGRFLCFLDADDLLLPDAIAVGVKHLSAHPECAFVSGDHRRVGPDLQPLFKFESQPILNNHYAALLRGNYIGMHAAVLYRREQLEEAGGFDESVRACEDYDLYLRIAREHPVLCHAALVADYRQHGSNMSRDPKFMLSWALQVHARQYPFVEGDAVLEAAFREGIRNWREYYGSEMLSQIRARFRMSPADLTSIYKLPFVARNYYYGRSPMPSMALLRTTAWMMLTRIKWRRYLRRPRLGSFASTAPIGGVSASAGTVRARYESDFLKSHLPEDQDVSLEIGDGATDLSSVHEVEPRSCSLVVCRELHRAYELSKTIASLQAVLKEDGVLLALLPGVALPQTPDDPSDYWRWTAISARRAFEEHFPGTALRVTAYGNVLANTCQLHGIPASELSDDELAFSDPRQQLVVGVRAANS